MATRTMIVAVARRQLWSRLAVWAAGAGAVAALSTLLTRVPGVPAFPAAGRWIIPIALLATGAFRARRASDSRDAAAAIERICRASRNLVVTAEELERHPERASSSMRRHVFERADAVLATVHPDTIVPLRTVLLPLGIAIVLFSVAIFDVKKTGGEAGSSSANTAEGLPPRGTIRVFIQPPAYARIEPTVLSDPTRIEALEGSVIRFELPPGWRVRAGSAPASPTFVARESGYFAIEPPQRDARLIPLAVTRDRAPSVRITAPAKDLLLAEGSRTIPIDLTASDDLGLRSLEVRYTKVSGSGEHFEFDEGVLAADLTRSSARDWTAHAALALPALRLGPGDSLVYRAVARDGRPGDAGAASSDTYFVEIAGPGQIALAGVDMPPELDRYAMSQQMIVVKLERLRARARDLPREAFAEEAVSIAAEQRTVRANFVFMLGGHVEDEEEEAAQSHEIQEGRLENTARKDINAAISQMSRVEQRLAGLDVAAALPPARAAVESLQRAFGRSRYLLRSLPSQSRLDPSRRLTGELEGAGERIRERAEAEPRQGAKARQLLTMLLDLAAGSQTAERPEAARWLRAAEFALSIDPASPLWQEVARTLSDAGDAAALQHAIATVWTESLRGTIPRTDLSSTPASPLERVYSMERRR